MATIKGIYKHYEGTDSQCSGVQLERELTWATNIGATGCLRYLDCNGGHHYIEPGYTYFYPTSDYSRGSGVYYSGPSGVNDFIKFGYWGFIRMDQNGNFRFESDSGNPMIIRHGSNSINISGSNSVNLIGGNSNITANAAQQIHIRGALSTTISGYRNYYLGGFHRMYADCGTIEILNIAGSVTMSGTGGIYLKDLITTNPHLLDMLWVSGHHLMVSQG